MHTWNNVWWAAKKKEVRGNRSRRIYVLLVVNDYFLFISNAPSEKKQWTSENYLEHKQWCEIFEKNRRLKNDKTLVSVAYKYNRKLKYCRGLN